MNDGAGRGESASAALWASAMVIAALILVVAGRRDGGTPARADVATVGDIVATNIRSGSDEDVVAVLDTRAEIMLVYKVENRQNLELVQSLRLPALFAEAKDIQGPRRR